MRINLNYQWIFRTITVLTILYNVFQIPFQIQIQIHSNSDSICSLEIPRSFAKQNQQSMQAPLVTACPSSPGVEQLNQYGNY